MFTGFDRRLAEAIMEDRMREAAEFRLRRQARASRGQGVSYRPSLFGRSITWLRPLMGLLSKPKSATLPMTREKAEAYVTIDVNRKGM